MAVTAGALSAMALLPASSAFAGQYILGYDPPRLGFRLTYQGFGSDRTQTEKNTVTITQRGAEVILTDATAPVAQAVRADGSPRGADCRQVDANTVACPSGSGGRAITYLSINAGSEDDVVTNDTGIASQLLGGFGNDRMTGGNGPDVLDGDGGQDILDGRGGNDEFATDGSPVSEHDKVACGAGTDTARIDRRDQVDNVQPPYDVNAAPTSCERIVLEGRTVGTTPSAPGTGGPSTAPVPRQPGEAPLPRLPGGFEAPPGGCGNAFLGTRRADRFIGNDSGDRMLGRGGADVMFGFDGADCLFGERGNDRLFGGGGGDLIVGGPGNDLANGGPGNDRIFGSGGRDRLIGGRGRDRIVVGPGRNRVSAGAGRDVVDSANRRRDVVRCGSGRDTVHADRVDRLIGCERRR